MSLCIVHDTYKLIIQLGEYGILLRAAVCVHTQELKLKYFINTVTYSMTPASNKPEISVASTSVQLNTTSILFLAK